MMQLPWQATAAPETQSIPAIRKPGKLHRLSLAGLLEPRVALASVFVAAFHGRRSRRRSTRNRVELHAAPQSSQDREVVRRAGLEGSDSFPAAEVLEALTQMEAAAQVAGGGQESIQEGMVEGRYVLVFSSVLIGIPFVDGFMPNREVLEFAFGPAGCMSLKVETLPFLPSLDIVGEDCAFDAASRTVSYRIRGKTETSIWSIIYVDKDVIAARSNVTGLNIARRLFV